MNLEYWPIFAAPTAHFFLRPFHIDRSEYAGHLKDKLYYNQSHQLISKRIWWWHLTQPCYFVKGAKYGPYIRDGYGKWCHLRKNTQGGWALPNIVILYSNQRRYSMACYFRQSWVETRLYQYQIFVLEININYHRNRN